MIAYDNSILVWIFMFFIFHLPLSIGANGYMRVKIPSFWVYANDKRHDEKAEFVLGAAAETSEFSRDQSDKCIAEVIFL